MIGMEKNYTEFYQAYRKKIYYFFLNCAYNNVEDGEELTSLLFEKIWSKLNDYDPNRAGLYAWAMGFARNICARFREKKANHKEEMVDPREPGFQSELIEPGPGPVELVLGRFFHDDFAQIIQNLPENERAVVLLKMQGFKIREIEAKLEIRRVAIQDRYTRARRLMLQALRAQEYHPGKIDKLAR